jgi:SAM-dependent methyltransferase
MAFSDADAYARFMGRWSVPLSGVFLDFAALPEHPRVLDVGCGTGVLTAELVHAYGAAAVSAIDPSPPFVEAAREREPDVDVRLAAAESLPYPDDTFDAALAQLVVHFMADAPAGIAEIARVTRPGGILAACVWDNAGARGPLSLFWDAARDAGYAGSGEATLAGSREGDLGRLLRDGALAEVTEDRLDVTLPFATFEAWWEPFTLGVGPAGDHLASLDPAGRERLAAACRARLPEPPFELTVSAWAARGIAPPR